MNTSKFLQDPSRSLVFEKLIIQDPEAAYVYLRTSFFFDVFMLLASIAGAIAIYVTKTDFILYYILVSFCFVYYIRNVLSVSNYIKLFVTTFVFKVQLIDFYIKASEEEQIIIDNFINTLSEPYREIYKTILVNSKGLIKE